MKVNRIRVSKRKCGERKPGGFYFVGGPPQPDPYGWLFRAVKCSCGIQFMKPSRNVQHCLPYDVFPELRPESKDSRKFYSFKPLEKAWVVTVDADNYKTPQDWLDEAEVQGISRRINDIPRGFKVGESWVLVMHAKVFDREVTIDEGMLTETTKTIKEPGIIAYFRPRAIQYVCKGNETKEELLALAERGVTPVIVETSNSAHEDQDLEPIEL